MTVLSTSCKCSACVKKYSCMMYKRIVQMQKLVKDYADDDELILRFQTEHCKVRVVDSDLVELKGG